MSTCIRKWTEAFGKHEGCRYWSAEARTVRGRREPRHEHVVPRKLLIDALEALDDRTDLGVAALLESHAIACVVTRRERARLPDLDWSRLRGEPWARDAEARIDVVDPWAAGSAS